MTWSPNVAECSCSGDAPYQLSVSSAHVHLISLHETVLGGIRLKTTTLDPATGHKVDQHTLSSDGELSSAESIIFVQANSAAPVIVWADPKRKVLKASIIGTDHVSSIDVATSGPLEQVSVHAPSTPYALPHFLVHFQDSKSHWAVVYHVDIHTKVITKAYSLPKLVGRGAFSVSTSDANVYFARTTQDELVLLSSASHGVLTRWPLELLTEPGLKEDRIEHPYPQQAVSEVVLRDESTLAVRTAVLLSNGYWEMILNGKPTWFRPEVLSGTIAAAFAEDKRQDELLEELEAESHANLLSAYIHRARRHLHDLQTLPSWLQRLAQRLPKSLSGGDPDPRGEIFEQDTFGYHKLLVALTDKGRLVALDAGGQGRILWNVDAKDLSVDGKTPIDMQSSTGGFLTIKQGSSERWLAVNSTFPRSLAHAPERARTSSQPDVFYMLEDGQLQGSKAAERGLSPLWHFVPRAGEKIVFVTSKPETDPVASIGRVLGDRRVLYKYLDPNLVLVTATNEASGIASFYLLDSVSGDTLYSSSHSGVDTKSPITSIISENWLAYSFSSSSGSKGSQLVIAELYESALPNERGHLGSSTNYSSLEPLLFPSKPYIAAQSYQIPEAVSSMSVTLTAQGITTRQLLVTLPQSSSIVGIPRTILNPRRPIGRDPTRSELEEGLTRYNPVLDFDPKWYLNHRREVLGLRKTLTTPALLESTSLVFAYGLDVFGTRVAPSGTFDVLGKSFNKVQMLLTVAALFALLIFVKPIVSLSRTAVPFLPQQHSRC